MTTSFVTGQDLSSNSLREFIDALAAPVYTTDADGRLTYFNAAAAKLAGRAPQIGIDRWSVAWKLFLSDGTPLPHEESPLAVTLKGGEVAAGTEFIAERPDGTRFWFIPRPSLVRDSEGRTVGGADLLIDITARKLEELKAEADFRAILDSVPGSQAVGHDITERNRIQRAALLLSAVVDSSDDAIISKDLDGIITSWNRSAERLFGYTAEEAIGQSVASLLIPADRQNEEPQILARLRSGERVDHFETVRRRKDGTLLNISLTISPIKDPQGVVIGASKIARDVTDTYHSRRAASLLSAIVDSSDDAIISKDLNGVITSWNKSAERLFGYTAEEAVGQAVATLLIPSDRQNEEPQILQRLSRGERVDHFETVRKGKDGKLRDISLTVSPIRDMTGAIVGASKIARDVTESKRIRAALIESEARFRQLADTMPQIVWTATPQGDPDYFNERWFQFSGLNPAAVTESSWQAIVHPDDVERVREAWSVAIHSGAPYNTEYRFWDVQENRWRWFVARAVPVRDEHGSIVKWFGTFTDIDEQKRVEADLRRANADLEQFAFSASHDLQEPLRAVKIYSELLIKRYGHKLEGDAATFLGYLRAGATRMETLVRDLLAYTQATRVDTGSINCDAEDVFQSVMANLAAAVVESGAQVSAGSLPQVSVHPTHLQQVLQNLIGNAVKYRNPDRPPVVRVTAEQNHDVWLFKVTDNGIGIAAQYRENIFGLFKRLHSSDEYSGTGIGLAICQRIVERYQGRIWVESEPGAGSTFLFTLPG